jgi:hypothetical protein
MRPFVDKEQALKSREIGFAGASSAAGRFGKKAGTLVMAPVGVAAISFAGLAIAAPGAYAATGCVTRTFDVVGFNLEWNDVNGQLGETTPSSWKALCELDWYYGFRGAYHHDAGCPTEPGL